MPEFFKKQTSDEIFQKVNDNINRVDKETTALKKSAESQEPGSYRDKVSELCGKARQVLIGIHRRNEGILNARQKSAEAQEQPETPRTGPGLS